jgi:hypothetical protein
MNEKIKVVIIGLVAIVGFTIGTLSNSTSSYASGSCPNLTCEWDSVGFRCFNNDIDGIICNDSGYPDCTETPCTSPGESG